MKKIYIAPEMEILDAELEGILAASGENVTENGPLGEGGARQYGGDFDDFDDEYEDEF